MPLSIKGYLELIQESHGSQDSADYGKKFLFILFFVLAICFLPVLFVLFLNGDLDYKKISRFILFQFFGGGIVLLLFYNFVMSVPKSRRSPAVLAHLEDRLTTESWDKIMKTLGRWVQIGLNTRFNPVNRDHTKLCKAVLKLDEVTADKDLQFYIYLKLFYFYSIDENFSEAVKALLSALERKPADLMVNLYLAETYETIGNGGQALDTYQNCLDLSGETQELAQYFESQIERIRRDGPSTGTAISGLRYMTY